MTMTNKLTITLLLLISIAFFHCLAFRLETEEFEPPQQEEQEGHGGSSGKNPYHFGKWSFKRLFRSKEVGFVKMLPKFTKRSSTLFRGIENHRFLFMEMEPNSFLVPHHFDADLVFIVLQGQENMLRNLDTVATRLSFGVGSKMAEKLFRSQNYSHFAPAVPEKRKPSFQSVFNVAGF